MATSATIRQTRTVVVDGGETKFKLQSLITDTSGFRAGTSPVLTSTRSLFLLDDTGAYQHLCRVGDVEEYEDGPPAGANPYYRVAEVTLLFDTVEEAQAEADAQKQGLSDLVTDYDAYKNEYVTEPPTYPSGYEDTTYSVT